MYTIVVLLTLASWADCLNPEVDEKFHNLPHEEFVEYFNNQNFSYKIDHYKDIDKKALSCSTVGNHSIPAKPSMGYELNLPSQFNAQDFWDGCLIGFQWDQQDCGACWAITTAFVAQARTCISRYHRSYRRKPVKLEHLTYLDLTCCKDCYGDNFCDGGSPEKAALFWIKSGLVTNMCKPYHEIETYTCQEKCENGEYYNPSKYFGWKLYVMPANDYEIRQELITGGPLIATFAMYEDFKDYRKGVYTHTHGKLIGYHTVQVFGYGEESGVPYWLVANTWGTEWGARGKFKVKRFDEHLEFENNMLQLIPRSELDF